MKKLLLGLTLLGSFTAFADVSDSDRALLSKCYDKMNAAESVFSNKLEDFDEQFRFRAESFDLFDDSLKICQGYLKALKNAQID